MGEASSVYLKYYYLNSTMKVTRGISSQECMGQKGKLVAAPQQKSILKSPPSYPEGTSGDIVLLAYNLKTLI